MKYGIEKKEENLEVILAKCLCSNDLTISTAESCTGGLVAGRLISYPGISKVYLEGVITYSNESKIKRLNVKEETLKKHGAVSEETAIEMASGVANATGSKIAIVTTGIAGPDGGTEEKPVGLVYIGIYIKGNVKVKKFIFKGNRDCVRNKSVDNAFEMLIDELKLLGYC